MTERHHYKYVVLDSSKENGNAVQARFNVQIPHGITNASRVCVKSFSMPNVIHSVYGDLKTVRFVEFYRPTAGGNWVYDIFNFTLPDGYGGQNFTSQIVPLGFRRWTPLTRLCDQKHGSRAPWGASEISKFLAKLRPPYPLSTLV